MKTDLKPTDTKHPDGTVSRDGVRYGCHCDLAPDEAPDGCVIDYDRHGDCMYAFTDAGNPRRSRWGCPHWTAFTQAVAAEMVSVPRDTLAAVVWGVGVDPAPEGFDDALVALRGALVG